MKGKGTIGRISTKEARKCAIEDMKKAHINYGVLFKEYIITHQPVITMRGLSV